MSRNSSRLVFALLLAFAGSPLLAAPSPRTTASRAPDSARAMAASAGQLWHHLTNLWAAIGCTADPNGAKCASSTTGTAASAVTATIPVNIGCGIDPDGLR